MFESFWSADDMHWVVRTTAHHELLAVRSDFEASIEALTKCDRTAESYEFMRLCLRNIHRGIVERAIYRLRKQRKQRRRKK